MASNLILFAMSTASLFYLEVDAALFGLVQSFDSLTVEHFDAIEAPQQPDVVILGTGKRQRFILSMVISKLTAQHKAWNAWTIKRVCRTYNILMAEGLFWL